MPRVKLKTKAENLERVRNNQRKCRQRRRDYVAELEGRIASYQEAAIQANLSFQAEGEQLRMENQALRTLLDSSGADPVAVEQFLAKKCQEGTSKERQLDLVATNPGSFSVGLDTDPTTLQLSNTISEFVGSSTTVTEFADPGPLGVQLPPSPFTAFGDSFGLAMSNIYMPNLHEGAPERHLTDFLSVTTQNISGYIPTGLIDDVLQDTTLCTVAIQIVSLCNKKNLNLLELDSKLRHGYRNARAPLEGCRVDNWVLLSVLAEIIH
ncbi:hypothetical protein BGW36DRAFT_383451 [Talaromyces proteolyticus]|uniref:BZIP domain-containing protein n=1 Tax=Talaromyces proteolyticus TaxID=1131652 RepID=A0AAD4KQY7_9EURO|nr:uncharacterized protein BGW36DRAFT_383451 [Talaromyces proteolyticus]KAH8693647.1 hypothetical protein BGW36DRAFT_383451 [Talaromyces proteolyticus]